MKLWQHSGIVIIVIIRWKQCSEIPAASSAAEMTLLPAAAAGVHMDRNLDEADPPALCSAVPAPQSALPSCFARWSVLGLPNHLCWNTSNVQYTLTTTTAVKSKSRINISLPIFTKLTISECEDCSLHWLDNVDYVTESVPGLQKLVPITSNFLLEKYRKKTEG